MVSGSFDIGRLQDLLDFHPPEGTESTTVGGLVTEWLGHVPEAGETIERDGITMKVLSANQVRVDQVRVAKAALNAMKKPNIAPDSSPSWAARTPANPRC